MNGTEGSNHGLDVCKITKPRPTVFHERHEGVHHSFCFVLSPLTFSCKPLLRFSCRDQGGKLATMMALC